MKLGLTHQDAWLNKKTTLGAIYVYWRLQSNQQGRENLIVKLSYFPDITCPELASLEWCYQREGKHVIDTLEAYGM